MLNQRPTKRLLDELKRHGVDTGWVLSDLDATGYEKDHHELITYPREWAVEYAKHHWISNIECTSDSFLGAFPGREWACQVAEKRGYWAVLQLDDNIIQTAFGKPSKVGIELAKRYGFISFLDLLAQVTFSTNSCMTGASLSAVATAKPVIARKGFPYSCFVEQVGPGRERWWGPFEDDITHALQYGTRHDGVTAALMPLLRYGKESKSTTGMRSAYNHTRSVQLQRCFPESVKLSIRHGRANGYGDPRVFHHMDRNAIRNPLRVKNPEIYQGVGNRLTEILSTYDGEAKNALIEKVRSRIKKTKNRVGLSY